jgi:hypothetical protein
LRIKRNLELTQSLGQTANRTDSILDAEKCETCGTPRGDNGRGEEDEINEFEEDQLQQDFPNKAKMRYTCQKCRKTRMPKNRYL